MHFESHKRQDTVLIHLFLCVSLSIIMFTSANNRDTYGHIVNKTNSSCSITGVTKTDTWVL